ncbi:hypothetical protein HK102_006064 [Quaeritorhiza haematococci]|nr:hypothetical protein HK102_006064 [Quaeritorhiza haematococci]
MSGRGDIYDTENQTLSTARGAQANRMVAENGEYTFFYVTHCEKVLTQCIRVASNATVDQLKNIAVAEFNKEGGFTELSVKDATIYPTPRSTSTTLGQLEKLNSNTPPIVVCWAPQASSPSLPNYTNTAPKRATTEEQTARGWTEIAEDGARPAEELNKKMEEQKIRYEEEAAIQKQPRMTMEEELFKLVGDIAKAVLSIKPQEEARRRNMLETFLWLFGKEPEFPKEDRDDDALRLDATDAMLKRMVDDGDV